MPKLSPISARELITILEKQGFQQVHQKGSHVRLVHPDGRRTTIPVHNYLKLDNRTYLYNTEGRIGSKKGPRYEESFPFGNHYRLSCNHSFFLDTRYW